jgi:peptidoglycan/xylan/chitin deacetylase (PgdA/CDA1 family)
MRNKSNKSNNIKYVLIFFCTLFLGFIMVALIFCNVRTINIEDEVIEAGEEYLTTPKFYWFGKDITNMVTTIGRVDVKTLGKYEMTYMCLIRQYHKTVTVVDTQAPVITLEGETEDMVLTNIDKFVEPGYTAIDKAEGDVTNQVTKSYNQVYHADGGVSYDIIYKATDSSGNRSLAKRTIKIEKGTVYLTFDDGPSYTVTPRILEILENYGIKATFFVNTFEGNSNKEAFVKQEVEDGNSIALHGTVHEYKDVYESLDSTVNNFLTLQAEVERVTGVKSTLIRFPGGSSNTISRKYSVGIMTEATQKMEELGFTYFDWNVDSDDAGNAKTAQEIYQNVISGIKEGRANIVLMHDSGTHTETAEALTDIIEWCLREGYKFEALDEKSPTAHHSINN